MNKETLLKLSTITIPRHTAAVTVDELVDFLLSLKFNGGGALPVYLGLPQESAVCRTACVDVTTFKRKDTGEVRAVVDLGS